MNTNLLRNKFFVFTLICVAGLLAYSNTFTVPFQFDDDGYIVNNPIIRSFRYFLHPSEAVTLNQQSPTAFPIGLRYAFMTRFLGYLSLAMNYHLHGLDVAGYHIVNLLLHIINSFLVYLILRNTFKTALFSNREAEIGSNSHDAIALLSSLLFVCHPIQTHAVTYITSRFVLLATFFFLLSLFLYISSTMSTTDGKRHVLHAAALVSAAAAMVTKEFTFTLPLIIMLYDLVFLSRSTPDRIKTLAPFSLTLFIIPTLVFIQQGKLQSLDSTMRVITAADVSQISRSDYLLTQFRVIITYIRLLFFPINQSIDHDVPVYHSLFQLPVFASFTVLLTLISMAVYLCFVSNKASKYPVLKVLSFGILWFFITLSVESSIIPLGELIAEYRVYLPSIGMIVAFVSLGVFFANQFPELKNPNKVVIATFCTLAIIILVTTYVRNTVWKDEITLWENAVKTSPALVRPHQNLGMYYSMRGRLEDARNELVTALKLDPNNYKLHNNLGIVFKKLGDYDRAIREFQTVMAIMPSDAMVHYNLGNVYLEQGHLQEAIQEYKTNLKVVPDYDDAHLNLGIAYKRSGQLREAVREFTAAIALNPQNESAKSNLASCTTEIGTARNK
ncbi:MAG TPA: tetratricopeptide repeat protein [Nitrospirota bacterium]|nr:tetratricopeptide repeat protein [Nitrospirota bacterium]